MSLIHNDIAHYYLVPGEIVSKNDGDVHYIAGYMLRELYQITKPNQVTTLGVEDLYHPAIKQIALDRINQNEPYSVILQPRDDGNYYKASPRTGDEVFIRRHMKDLRKSLDKIILLMWAELTEEEGYCSN